MPAPFLAMGGLVVLMVAVHALVTGKAMAGSRGFKAHCYHREDPPLLYCFFLTFYLLAGSLALYQSF